MVQEDLFQNRNKDAHLKLSDECRCITQIHSCTHFNIKNLKLGLIIKLKTAFLTTTCTDVEGVGVWSVDFTAPVNHKAIGFLRNTVDSEIFSRILLSLIVLKDIFATLKILNKGMIYLYQ